MVILSKGAGAKRALLRRGGTPGETRTHYIPLRRRTLYPGEVRGHMRAVSHTWPHMGKRYLDILTQSGRSVKDSTEHSSGHAYNRA